MIVDTIATSAAFCFVASVKRVKSSNERKLHEKPSPARTPSFVESRYEKFFASGACGENSLVNTTVEELLKPKDKSSLIWCHTHDSAYDAAKKVFFSKYRAVASLVLRCAHNLFCIFHQLLISWGPKPCIPLRKRKKNEHELKLRF
ncbi:hypothetical protein EJ110_NYTH57495 [Nymphaea thermarum]|nr:hypothetical protein EJ110_NYTH57495 [Nymphaea thermarum]